MQFLNPVTVATIAASIWATAGSAALAQQQPISAQSAAQKLMAVPDSKFPGRMHVLPATMETTQWGWFDNAELPRLIIDSGDTVAIESMSHSHGQLYPGRTIEELKKLRTDWPARGPMTLTGPIFVNGAEPGDTLQIKIQKIVPRPWGANFNVPGLFGQFPSRFPDGQVKYFYLDNEKKTAEFAPGLSKFRCGRSRVPLASRARSPAVTTRCRRALRRQSGQSRPGRGNDAPCSGLRSRGAGLAGRFTRGAGQWRGQPDRARDRLPGNHTDDDSRQDDETRVAAHRDPDRVDHDGFRRGSHQGACQRQIGNRKIPCWNNARFRPSRRWRWFRRRPIVA